MALFGPRRLRLTWGNSPSIQPNPFHPLEFLTLPLLKAARLRELAGYRKFPSQPRYFSYTLMLVKSPTWMALGTRRIPCDGGKRATTKCATQNVRSQRDSVACTLSP